ncbi:unnamed protein product [Calicophoron daubneyi]|uniref:PDZ domain-containing protein n=1 Tax=Calicophoron daubneyi TaxID=300641 RepID=A0AAV2T9C2_CALDB
MHGWFSSASENTNNNSDRNRSKWKLPSHFPQYAGAGLLLAGLWLRRTDEEGDFSPSFPITVKCAQITTKPKSKDRQSAVQALDVIADVAEEAQPAVVSIRSSERDFRFRSVQSGGSGFIIDEAGHVITNAHVVGHRAEVFVHLSDGSSYPGRVLALDTSSDLALIQLDVTLKTAKALPRLQLAENLKSVRPGHFVLALGSPLMLANTVTVGVVSALDRDLGHSEGLKYIQTDAIITFGNSGGPLVNLAGEVIGVNSMIAGTGVGFAIPVDQVRRFTQLALQAAERSGKTPTSPAPAGDSYILTEHGTTPSGRPQRRYLGLIMRKLTPELAFELAARAGPHFLETTEGVLIQGILRNSPAQRAGLKPGDIIIAIDGLPVKDAHQVYAAAESRDEMSITIIRRGQRLTINNVHTEKV